MVVVLLSHALAVLELFAFLAFLVFGGLELGWPCPPTTAEGAEVVKPTSVPNILNPMASSATTR
jgi:hypothetical protein